MDAWVERGRWTAAEVAAIRAEGARIAADLEAGSRWWSDDWAHWEPDPTWVVPAELPQGWDTVVGERTRGGANPGESGEQAATREVREGDKIVLTDATLAGFTGARVTDVNIRVGLTATVDLSLKVASVQAEITVSAHTTDLELQSPALGNVVTGRQMVELPIVKGGVPDAALGRLPDPLAAVEAERVAGDRLNAVHFAWAGGGEPGQPHYYRLQGPRLLIEYVNVQNGANHVHSVWRDPLGDFGQSVSSSSSSG